LAPLVKTLVVLNDAICKAVKIVVAGLATVMVSAIIWQVFMRYVFNRPPSWTEELALLMFTWSMLLMTAVGVRESFHVRMDLLLQRLSARGKEWFERTTALVIAGFGLYLAWAGVVYVHDTHGSTSAAIGYAIDWLHGAAPVAGGLIAWFALERALVGMPEEGSAT
jgi:TRAP-type C4-dicarboxylate transport system permease small subunit